MLKCLICADCLVVFRLFNHAEHYYLRELKKKIETIEVKALENKKNTISVLYFKPQINNQERLISAMSEPLKQETFLAIRKAYDDAELEVSGRYDKWILTLSGGALALSITFIDKISKKPAIETLCWLKISWICLVLSLLTALLSLVTSQAAIRENRNELDLAYTENRGPKEFSRRFTNFTNYLNWGSLLLFITGIALLCYFSLLNIDNSIKKGDKKMEKPQSSTSSQSQNVVIGDGYTPPPPPPTTSQSGEGRGFVPPPPPPPTPKTKT